MKGWDRRAPQGDSVSASLLFPDATVALQEKSSLQGSATAGFEHRQQQQHLARSLRFDDDDDENEVSDTHDGLHHPRLHSNSSSDGDGDDDDDKEEGVMAAAFALQLEAEATAEFEAEEAELEEEERWRRLFESLGGSLGEQSVGTGHQRRPFRTFLIDVDEDDDDHDIENHIENVTDANADDVCEYQDNPLFSDGEGRQQQEEDVEEDDGFAGGFMRPSTDWRSLKANRVLFVSRNSKVRGMPSQPVSHRRQTD